jgi:tRNA pseudouridine38-40 synthase
VIAYEGTSYLGWQKTKEGPSIEQALETVLEQILQHPVKLQAASRTDAGVHAEGQVVNFFTSRENLSLKRLFNSLNSLLAKDIVVKSVEEMAQEFHPTLDCCSKEYHYWICFGSYQLPQHRFFSWHIHHFLDFDALRLASAYLIGHHDFSSFTNKKKNESYTHLERCVDSIQILEHPSQRLQVILKGNNFLYKMARNLVGTLVDVGTGKFQASQLPAIFEGRSRILSGVTAPAHGLTLYQVNF